MKGRPVLGAFSGFFFGLFLALALFQWQIWPLDALTVYGLPNLFLVIGISGGLWGPLGRKRLQPAPAAEAPAPPAEMDEPAPPPAAMDEPPPPPPAEE